MKDEHVVVVPIEHASWVESRPTGFLRWSGGKLQQQWSIIEHGGPNGGSSRLEWRDVLTDTSGGEGE